MGKEEEVEDAPEVDVKNSFYKYLNLGFQFFIVVLFSALGYYTDIYFFNKAMVFLIHSSNYGFIFVI